MQNTSCASGTVISRNVMRNTLRIMLASNIQKSRMRWGNADRTDREQSQLPESVMSHIGSFLSNMYIMKDMALQTTDRSLEQLDWVKVPQLIVTHDSPEIGPAGDIRIKTPTDKQREEEFELYLLGEASRLGMSDKYQELMDEYSERTDSGSKNSQESRAVKCGDEIDALVYMIFAGRVDIRKRTHRAEREFFHLHAEGLPFMQEFGLYLADLVEKLDQRGIRSASRKLTS